MQRAAPLGRVRTTPCPRADALGDAAGESHAEKPSPSSCCHPEDGGICLVDGAFSHHGSERGAGPARDSVPGRAGAKCLGGYWQEHLSLPKPKPTEARAHSWAF